MDKPDYLSPEWSDFVMSQFSDREIVDSEKHGKMPTLSGLRRVSQTLLGDVVESYPEHIQSEFGINNFNQAKSSAVIKYTVVFDWGGSGEIRKFSAMAEVNTENTDTLFLGYPVATAESRAESRAYKKALLFKGLTSDEIPRDKNVAEGVSVLLSKGATSGEIDNDGPITSQQKQIISKRCKDLDINLLLFLNIFSPDGPYENIDQVTKESAAKMVSKLTKYEKEEEAIPEEILIVKNEDTNKINKKQKTVITKNCETANIDLFLFINSNSKYGPYKNIDQVPKDIADKMLLKLTKYVNGEDPIPNEILVKEKGAV